MDGDKEKPGGRGKCATHAQPERVPKKGPAVGKSFGFQPEDDEQDEVHYSLFTTIYTGLLDRRAEELSLFDT